MSAAAPSRRRRARPALYGLAGAVALLGLSRCGAIYREAPHAGEQVGIASRDGWPLAMRHYAPRGEPRATPPVILCHGVVTNAYYMDLDEQHSLARWLAGRGFDVWALDLRGHGDSGKPSLFGSLARDWSFDDYVEKDVPAAIDAVRARTGASKVAWVGHSMGGMVLYAHLARAAAGASSGAESDGGIARAVTMGSPATFRHVGRGAAELARPLGALTVFPTIPFDVGTSLLVSFSGRFYGPLERLMYVDGNLEGRDWRAFLARGVDDESSRLGDEFLAWIDRGAWTSPRDGFGFEAALAAVRAPIMVVAGRGDNLAPAELVRYGYDALGSRTKRWVVLGLESGMRSDYGHMDMVLGPRAPAEVFPLVAEWLAGE